VLIDEVLSGLVMDDDRLVVEDAVSVGVIPVVARIGQE